MAPSAHIHTSAEVVVTSASGGVATPATWYSPRSQSWRKKLQERVSTLKSLSGAEKSIQNTLHTMPEETDSKAHSTTRSALSLFEPGRKRNYKPAASLQSESFDSLTSASLFSRHSHPSINSSGTDATSISGISTTCGIMFAVDGHFVKPYKRMKDSSTVYLAHDDIEISLDVIEQWENTDRDRLKTDLSEAIMDIYRKGIERQSRRPKTMMYLVPGANESDIVFELRMSGRAARDAQHVAIRPTIWIVCGSTWACKEIRAAMDQITWPTLGVEVHEGRVPVPSVAEGEIDVNKLDLTDGYHFGDGITLYIHIETPSPGASYCGLLCCATVKNGDTYSHHFSRMGGLVMATNTLFSSQFGVSTAHGMLNHPWWHNQLQNNICGAKGECQIVESTGFEPEYGSDGDAFDDDDDQAMYDEQEHASDAWPCAPYLLESKNLEGYRDPRLVSQWKNVSCHSVLSFNGASISTESDTKWPSFIYDDTGTQTDHAMMRLDWPQPFSSQAQTNKYFPKEAHNRQSTSITTHMTNDELVTGAVTIICQANSTVVAHVLPGSTCLAIGGRIFTLKKLKTSSPLARGVSGSWVAKGSKLCGMIIAVASGEHYSYMMRAEDLMFNLLKSNPSIETIEVSNPDTQELRREADGAQLQTCSLGRPPPQLVRVTESPRASRDDHRVFFSSKKGLGTQLRNAGDFLRLRHDTKNSISEKNGKPRRRRRTVRNLLPDIFNKSLEEIVQFSAVNDVDISQRPGAQHEVEVGSRLQSYHHKQAKPRYLARKRRRPPVVLEPISEFEDRESFISPVLLEPISVFEDLIEWWESWILEDDAGSTAGPTSRPLSPTSTTSDSFPGVSYSDTSSERSLGSGQTWLGRQDLTEQDGYHKYCHGHERQMTDHTFIHVLSGDSSSGRSLGAVSELTVVEHVKENTEKLCEHHHAQGITT